MWDSLTSVLAPHDANPQNSTLASMLREQLGESARLTETAVPILTMSFHIGLFSFVVVVAMLALNLVAAPNA